MPSIIIKSYKAKASHSYIARLTGSKPDQPRFTIIGSGSWSARVNGAAALMRSSIERANKQLDPRQQLANTSLPQSTNKAINYRMQLITECITDHYGKYR